MDLSLFEILMLVYHGFSASILIFKLLYLKLYLMETLLSRKT